MFVVKIGGSLLFDNEEKIDEKLITNYAKTIRNVFSDKKKNCAIVVGGGKLARKYISSSRALGATEAYNDIIGIEIAKLNARLLISALGDVAYPDPPETFQDFQSLISLTDKVIVCGGFQPGQSTNAVAASIAEITHAEKIVNLTDVDGVFSEDPDKNPKAKLLNEIPISDLIEKITSTTKAGHYPLFDLTAAQIIKRSNINLHFVNGSNPQNLVKAIADEKIGTKVTH